MIREPPTPVLLPRSRKCSSTCFPNYFFSSRRVLLISFLVSFQLLAEHGVVARVVPSGCVRSFSCFTLSISCQSPHPFPGSRVPPDK